MRKAGALKWIPVGPHMIAERNGTQNHHNLHTQFCLPDKIGTNPRCYYKCPLASATEPQGHCGPQSQGWFKTLYAMEGLKTTLEDLHDIMLIQK